jgi:hypothetical protein
MRHKAQSTDPAFRSKNKFLAKIRVLFAKAVLKALQPNGLRGVFYIKKRKVNPFLLDLQSKSFHLAFTS